MSSYLIPSSINPLAILEESESKDISLHFVEFSNVHNKDRSSNATRSKLAHKIV